MKRTRDRVRRDYNGNRSSSPMNVDGNLLNRLVPSRATDCHLNPAQSFANNINIGMIIPEAEEFPIEGGHVGLSPPPSAGNARQSRNRRLKQYTTGNTHKWNSRNSSIAIERIRLSISSHRSLKIKFDGSPTSTPVEISMETPNLPRVTPARHLASNLPRNVTRIGGLDEISVNCRRVAESSGGRQNVAIRVVIAAPKEGGAATKSAGAPGQSW